MTGQELKMFCSDYSVPDCIRGWCPHSKICSKLDCIPCNWEEKEIKEYDKIYGTKKSSDEGIN